MIDQRYILPSRQPGPGHPWPRDFIFAIVRTALCARETRFARQTALAWLGVFPGDLPAALLYAQALASDGHPDQAIPILEDICAADPEFLEAVQFLARIRRERAQPNTAEAIAHAVALGDAQEIGAKGLFEQTMVTWGRLVGQARLFLEGGDFERAEQMIHQALAAQKTNPLMAATHLKILQAQVRTNCAPPQAIRSLAEFYHSRWPNCLQCSLLLADALMDGGESENAVTLLHHAAARDVTGQVAARLWGRDHPYRALWPEHLEAEIELQIPAPVAAILGWNRLPAGSPVPPPLRSAVEEIEAVTTSKPSSAEQRDDVIIPTLPFSQPVPAAAPTGEAKQTRAKNDRETGETIPIPAATTPDRRPLPQTYAPVPETLRSVQAELERVAARLNRTGLVRSDGRLPVYIIMTTRKGLQIAYGDQGIADLENEMRRLAEAVQLRRNWRSLLFYADDGACLQGRGTRFAVQPARADDAWGLKLALADLDVTLARKGEMIGAVLIVGGPEVVPFHRLPNPVDDLDEEVQSDNPYATRDENYFIPEWPVGRLPGAALRGPQDAGPLLKSLRDLTGQHMALARQQQPRPWLQAWGERAATWLSSRGTRNAGLRPSFGYTAAVWRKASFTVFRPIGQPKAMLVSPPVQAAPVPEAARPDQGPTSAVKRRGPRIRRRKSAALMPAARLAYFNLHGLEDSAEWYGQSDPGDAGNGGTHAGPDYPVALRPQDVLNSGRAPHVVFSEACYGAHIQGKTVDEALALKFLQSGSQAVVGSTCTAYGSVGTPLIAADYLGQSFWNYLRKGLPAGEALRRAKIALAHEMHNRQGYLDGEDQKTLIAFVLYGDPLAQPLGSFPGPKAIQRPLKPPAAVKTVCDRSRRGDSAENLPEEVLAHVKSVVEQYLPGMADAHLTVSQEHAECQQAGHTCPTAQFAGKANLPNMPGRRLIILSKQVFGKSHLHTHYARLTLDAENRLVKMVVSR